MRGRSRAGRRWAAPIGLLLALVVAGLPASGGQIGQVDTPADTIGIIKTDTLPDNVTVALDVLGETFERADRVLVARDDNFADALASGLLQDDAPLLLVPSNGILPPGVRAAISDLGASEAVILGGSAAVSLDVERQLQDRGLATSRRAGGSRFDTAIDVARTDAPDARTVLLARAFPAPGAPESQAFADTLGAGGIAAREGFPILLTQTETLTEPTRDYMVGADIERVLIIGGTAAISQAVEDELRSLGFQVERYAGPSRVDTALETAKIGGDDSAADAARVILTDGQGDDAWAAGFALAAHAAAFDAPIVLSLGGSVPPATRQWLSSGIGGDPAVAPVLTCATLPSLCESARVAAQLPGAEVATGETLLDATADLPLSGGMPFDTGEPGQVITYGWEAPNVATEVRMLLRNCCLTALGDSLTRSSTETGGQVTDEVVRLPDTRQPNHLEIIPDANQTAIPGVRHVVQTAAPAMIDTPTEITLTPAGGLIAASAFAGDFLTWGFEGANTMLEDNRMEVSGPGGESLVFFSGSQSRFAQDANGMQGGPVLALVDGLHYLHLQPDGDRTSTVRMMLRRAVRIGPGEPTVVQQAAAPPVVAVFAHAGQTMDVRYESTAFADITVMTPDGQSFIDPATQATPLPGGGSMRTDIPTDQTGFHGIVLKGDLGDYTSQGTVTVTLR